MRYPTRLNRWLPVAFMLIAGCVPCLHSLYTDQDLLYDPALIGTWKISDGPDTLTFSKGDADNAYKMVYADKNGKSGEFAAHLLKLKGTLFLDLYPADVQLSQNDFYKAHLLPAHTFYRLDQITPKLQMAGLNYDWVKAYCTDHPSELAHDTLDRDQFVISAPTAELQKFVLAHLNVADAWDKPAELTPVAPKAP